MRVVGTLSCLFLFSVIQLLAASHPATDPNFGRVPLSFEANQGQADGSVRFVGRADGHVLYLMPSEAIMVMRDGKGQAALHMSFPGGRIAPEVTGEEELPGKSNFLRGNDPSRWRTNVPTYRSVLYREVFPGVDVRFHGNRSELEYDIVVGAGVDAGSVRLLFSGARQLSVDAEGNLVVRLPGGRIVRQHRPVIYQDAAGGRRNVAGSYRILERRKGSVEVSFALGAYDTARPLVIDPVMSFSTYFGGATARFSNEPWAVAVDRDGSVYIVGNTTANDLPVTSGVLQPAYKGGGDAFVAKLDASGGTILYCTYVGGSDEDAPKGIAVDASGNAYVTGDTRSTDFPTKNPLQATKGGGTFDVFAFKFNASGSALVYSTYLGGSADDHALGLAIDTAGAAYITGSTLSTNFPVKNAVQSTLTPSGSSSASTDVFIAKLDPTGAALAYSTYYGGSGSETGNAIAVDPSGGAYVTGRSDTGFPVTSGSFQGTRVCSQDAFVLKLNPSGGVAYSGCLGGSSGDEGRAIVADSSGNAYVVGGTTSGSGASGFPLVNPLQQPGGFEDVFLSKINPSGSALLFSTLLGGTQSDRGQGVALDSFNNIFVTGYAGSSNFPTLNPVQAATGAVGFDDAIVAKFKGDGSAMLWSTYLGGSTLDQARGIASDASGNVYITGITGSKNFPAVNALQSALGSGTSTQSFLTRIGEIPVINTGGILGGAAFTPPLTPGAIVSLFGNYLAASTGGAVAVPLSTVLSGTIVKVNGTAAPLYFSSPTQVNFQMPFEAPAGSAQVTVTLANLTSAVTTVSLAATAPGIFTTNSSGKGQGAVQNAQTGEFAAPAGSIPGAAARPIPRGQFITIYCAGLGAVNDPPASGNAALSSPLSRTLAPVTVTIGGVSVPADFAGLTPAFVGLYQVNVQIPANAPTGDAVTLTLSVGGTQSNSVTIAIQP